MFVKKDQLKQQITNVILIIKDRVHYTIIVEILVMIKFQNFVKLLQPQLLALSAILPMMWV